MRSKKQTEAEIVSLSGLGGIVETYKEIAATRITRTRNSVLKSHNFLGEINTVYEEVKSSYRRQLENLAKARKEKDIRKLSFIKNNGKTALIFLSSNTGLYGDIVLRTFNLFSDEVKNSDASTRDVAVVGRLGLFLVEEAKFPPPYYYFDFPDQSVPEPKLAEIASFLIQYEKVIVFYQEFKTLMRQQAVANDISGNVLEIKTTTNNPSQSSVKYLFEPSLEGVLEFFEKEIFASILEQTIRDSQLAKFASRLVTLDAASQNIRKHLQSAIFEDIRLRHREKNKKQSQTFSSMSLWT
jgi:ATP synthase F1 gamma subunit